MFIIDSEPNVKMTARELKEKMVSVEKDKKTKNTEIKKILNKHLIPLDIINIILSYSIKIVKISEFFDFPVISPFGNHNFVLPLIALEYKDVTINIDIDFETLIFGSKAKPKNKLKKPKKPNKRYNAKISKKNIKYQKYSHSRNKKKYFHSPRF